MTDSGTDIDLAGLERILAERLDANVTDAAVVADGLNLVVDVSTPDGRYVVRRPNKLRDTYYMNDLRAEYEVLEALVDTPVPAPRPVLFEADRSALGGPFLVCTYLEGETVPLGSDQPFADGRAGPLGPEPLGQVRPQRHRLALQIRTDEEGSAEHRPVGLEQHRAGCGDRRVGERLQYLLLPL